MIQDRIQKLEDTLQAAAGLPEAARAQLQQALDELKTELHPLSQERADDAQSIAGFADAALHESTRQEPKPALAEVARSGLLASVEGLESSHPHLVAVVNRIATILSNMGI